MSGGQVFCVVIASYFAGALLTAYVCGRWRFGEHHSTNNILLWPFALPIIALMWAYSKGERR